MAYVKPGVEVTQTQVTVSPSLISPDLGTVLIGKAFFVEEVGDYSYAEVYSGVQIDVDYAGLASGMEVHTQSLYVDIIGGTGASAGQFSKGQGGKGAGVFHHGRGGCGKVPTAV